MLQVLFLVTQTVEESGGAARILYFDHAHSDIGEWFPGLQFPRLSIVPLALPSLSFCSPAFPFGPLILRCYLTLLQASYLEASTVLYSLTVLNGRVQTHVIIFVIYPTGTLHQSKISSSVETTPNYRVSDHNRHLDLLFYNLEHQLCWSVPPSYCCQTFSLFY